MTSSLRTLEQQRAEAAWECINEVKSQSWASNYRSIATKAPSLILTNGLGQTLAFLRSKSKRESEQQTQQGAENEHAALYQHISRWIKQRLGIPKEDLLEWITTDANSQQYRLATAEALAFLTWLKRFAEAELPKPERGD